jgi:phosphoenolpyruvate carboxykinase (ATP)
MNFENVSRGTLIEHAVRRQGARLSDSGALLVWTGDIMGRSPSGKFIVMDDITRGAVDWSNNNSMSLNEWDALLEEFERYEDNKAGHKYKESVSASSDPSLHLNVDVHCELPSHALFVKNMFRKTMSEAALGTLTVKVYPNVRSKPCVAINFSERTVLITGTSYAGEIKKSVFTYLNFVLPSMGILPMHCSINCDREGKNPAVFFGLSGTGKTTLSADPSRLLLGDDEHGWSKDGVFNFEGGCYAKTMGLTPQSEPQIWAACHRFGTILENVLVNKPGHINFSDDSLTKNGRASYPLDFIGGSMVEGFVPEQPSCVIMLTCDAFGVLPAVSKLSLAEAKEQFLLGYTSKVAGTESGIDEPVATFSPCFGLPFMPRPPEKYASLLVDFLESTGATCWLVNTGWTGGPPGTGERIALPVTRAIVGCIVDGDMNDVPTFYHDQSGFTVPDIGGLDVKLLRPELAWSNPIMFHAQVDKLKKLIEDENL